MGFRNAFSLAGLPHRPMGWLTALVQALLLYAVWALRLSPWDIWRWHVLKPWSHGWMFYLALSLVPSMVLWAVYLHARALPRCAGWAYAAGLGAVVAAQAVCAFLAALTGH